jgi:glycosyltransferase involved in cell wall biosynthesis
MNTQKSRIIGIDARFYGPVGKGLGRYTQEVVDNVIAILSEETAVNFVIFLSPENFDDFDCDGKKVKKVLVKARWYTLAEQIEIPYRLWCEKVDLIHFPHFNVPILTTTPFIVTIHDLILTKFPTYRATTLHPIFYWFKDKAYRLVISLAVKRAKSIITVSEFTKNDLILQFRVKSSKILVTYEGVANLDKGDDSLFSMPADKEKVLSRYNISTPFLLYVGNAYPHKNLEGLINIFSKLKIGHLELRLVLIGKEDYFYSRVKEFAKHHNFWQSTNRNSQVTFPGYVPDADLRVIFESASAYVFPSLYEGFGLPPLEAMAHGCPVASSNRASMPEILGEAAIYFDPENEAEAVDAINILLSDEKKRQAMIELGYSQAKKYSWWECANSTSGAYLDVLSKLK